MSWLHVDYKIMKMNNDINKIEYRMFDIIVCVSNAIKRVFLNYIPELKDKTKVIYNIIDRSTLNDSSLNEVPVKASNVFTITTVSRIDANKNIFDCIEIAKKLYDFKTNFVWYIIGDGISRKEVEKKALEYNLSENIFFLGYLDNPYPYIKKSDLCVSCSLSESFGLFIYESLLLGTPVVAREYDAISEIMRDGKEGYVCVNASDMFEKIFHLINDTEAYMSLKSNLAFYKDKNKKSIDGFYEVIYK